LSNVGEQGQNENVGGKDVIEESGAKGFPSLKRVSAFLNSIVELSICGSGAKLKAKILAMRFDSEVGPFRNRFLEAGGKLLNLLVIIAKGNDNTFVKVEVQTGYAGK
jgi:hypothetical protein